MASKTQNFAEYLELTLSKDSDFKVIAFPDGLYAQSGFKYYTKTDLLHLSDKIASYYINHGLLVRQQGERSLNVTLLAYGTIEWAASFFAIVRMGHTVVSLSSRLSEEYVNILLEKSKSDVLVTDRAVTLSKSMDTISLPNEAELEALPFPSRAQVTCDTKIISPDDVCYYLHSSGSTSMPKLFSVTHAEWLNRASRNVKMFPSEKSIWTASALYNPAGIIVLTLTATHKATCYFENDRTRFSKEGALAFLSESRPDFVNLTPWTLGMLAGMPAAVSQLARCAGVTIFGAVCSGEIGDKLVASGVKLGALYGMTEAGTLATSMGRPGEYTEWQWLSIIPSNIDLIDMLPLSGSDGELFQMWCHPDCPEILPAVKQLDGWFCTGDLFLRHPTKKDRYKLVGRQDDQLKIYQRDRQSIINAVVYEKLIHDGNEDIVDEVVLFGQGRGKLGVLVFAEVAAQGSDRRVQFKGRIWRTIEEHINGKLPTPVDRDMIVIVDSVRRKDLPQTGKYNLIRPQIYLRFKDVIEAAYADENAGAVPDATTGSGPSGAHGLAGHGMEGGKDQVLSNGV